MLPNRKNKISLTASSKAEYGSNGPFCHWTRDNCRYETQAYECEDCNVVHRFVCHESHLENFQEWLDLSYTGEDARCSHCHIRYEHLNGRPATMMDVIKISSGEPLDIPPQRKYNSQPGSSYTVTVVSRIKETTAAAHAIPETNEQANTSAEAYKK